MELVSLDGTLVPVAEARIPVTDEGLLRGDGVFEVVRVYAGRPYALGEHLERMRGSARNLRLELDAEAFERDARALLDAADPGDCYLRLVATRGGRRIALLEAPHDYPPALSLGYVEYVPPRVLDGVKSLSYAGNMLASRLARERGFDEALLVTPHGRVLEAPTCSFFYALDADRLYTPPLEDHILDSITRRHVIAVTGAQERGTTQDDLATVSEAFLASTIREVHPVARIEDRELPEVPGPLTREAAAAVSERIRAALDAR